MSSSATPSRRSQPRSCVLQLVELAVQAVHVDAALQLEHGPHLVVLEVAREQAAGRRDAGMRRHEHLGDLERVGDLGRMQRAGAAERDERELARVVALLDRPRPDRARHVRVRDRQDAVGRLHQTEARAASRAAARRRPPRRDRASCGRRGTGRGGAARARGARRRSSGRCRRSRNTRGPGAAPALRGPTRNAPPSSTYAIEPPPAPIACTSSIGTSSGYPPIQVSRADASVTPSSVTIPMSAEVPPMSNVISRVRSASAPAHWPPRMPAAGPESRSVTGRSAAAWTLATPPLDIITCRSPCTPSLGEARAETLEVVAGLRSDERAHRGGREPLELAELRDDVGARRDECVRHLLADDLGCPPLVNRVEVGEEEADGDCLHALVAQLARGRADLVLVERRRGSRPSAARSARSRPCGGGDGRTASPATGCPA